MEFVPEEIVSHDNIIVGGLGGGADVFNALPLYAYLHSIGKKVTLVGVNGSSPSIIRGGDYITNYSKWINPSCKKKHISGHRIFEHLAARAVHEITGEPKESARVAYISRKGGIEGIAHALDIIAEDTESTAIILIDGGGDSLFCESHENVHSAKFSSDSDTMVIDAICGMVRAEGYVGIVSCGIDTPEDFEEVIEEMKKGGAYLGESDMRDFPEDVLLPVLKQIRSSIKMNNKDSGDRDHSHTVTSLYCSFLEMFKKVNTLAGWGKSPIQIDPSFTIIRFFSAYEMACIKTTFETKIVPPIVAVPVYAFNDHKSLKFWDKKYDVFKSMSGAIYPFESQKDKGKK